MCLEMFLLAGVVAGDASHAAAITSLVVQQSSLRIHQLCTAAGRGKRGGGLGSPRTAWPRSLVDQGPPAYANLASRPVQFVYDEEATGRHAKDGHGHERLRLHWAPLSRRGRRGL